jgi:hypothetical protein
VIAKNNNLWQVVYDIISSKIIFYIIVCTDLLEFIRGTTRIGYMETQCQEYLDNRTYRHAIHLDSGDYTDILELFAPVGSFTIQKIIDDHEDLDTIHLQRPAPNLLPIKISKIANDSSLYIIPSEILNIHAILPRAPRYHLEAIICDINQHEVIFMKNLTTNNWYYYQNSHSCEQLSDNLSADLNGILSSGSAREQKRLIESAHFLLSMVFYNAVKYVYKQQDK